MTDLLTTRVVARRLGVHPETVLKWMRAGDLPAFKLPSGAIRFSETEIDAWLDRRATSTRKLSPTTLDAARTHRLPSTVSPITDNEEA